ncbi:MAG: alpha/beta fold hydrolase [Thermoanaerobaculia bacterium]
MSRSILVVLLLLSSTVAAAEEVMLPRTTVQRISAEANGIDYKLYVSLPRDYATSRARYPVIYLLDADYSFAIAHNVVEHLADRGQLPWAIVVGIAYDGAPQYRMHRTRDYTPTRTLDLTGVPAHQQPYQKYTGGGPKFREFLAAELVPLIDRTYRTTRERVLVGHSYGGLFAAWMLLTTPDVFTGYVAISPSLWYDERLAFRTPPSAAMRGRVYLAAGAMENPIMGNDVRELTARLRKSKTITVRGEVMEGETHDSIVPGAFSRGVRWVLNGR